MNNNKAANIDMPNNSIIEVDDENNNSIIDPGAVLEKLTKLKQHKLNYKYYCDINIHG